jgi:hypothetical protein
MEDWLFVGIYGIGCLLLAVYGLVMAFSPKLAIRFLNWYSRADRWSRPNPDWGSGRLIQERFAGTALALIAFILASPLLKWINHPKALKSVSVNTVPNMAHGADWYALLVGMAMLLGGVYVLLEPHSFLRWIGTITPYRKLPEATDRRSQTAARMFGLLIAGSSLIPIYVWLKSIR